MLSTDTGTIVEHRPEACACCGASLHTPLPAQVVSTCEQIELPAVAPIVTQQRRLAVRCPSCGEGAVAPVPSAARGTPFGPRLHHAFVDRRLYLPKLWAGDSTRGQAAHVPEAITFATKPQLALAIIERAILAEVPLAWVAADSVYSVGEIELALRCANKGYVLDVTGKHRFWSWDTNLDVVGRAAEITKGISDKGISNQDWLRLSASFGTKGPRLFD